MNFFDIDKRILDASEKAMALCADKLREIDAIQEYHQIKMIKAFQNAGVRESYFAASTGYGYDDFGRDALDRVYAYVFDAEDALDGGALRDAPSGRYHALCNGNAV